MTDRRFTLLDAATVAVTAAIAALSLWVLTQAPNVPYPMHFNAAGEVDRWGDRRELALLFGFMAVMAAITAGMMGWYAGASDDPARRRGLRAGQAVSLVAIGGVSAIIGWASLGASLGAEPPAIGWTMVLTGLILVMVGAGLGRVGPNPLIGVRTPWAFKSRLAWDRSNRLAGRLFFWLGLVLILAGPFAPQPAGALVTTAAIILAAVWSVFESWRVWRSDPDRQPF
ncbi:SdpI family protein [Brevundimonas sp. VNH65]|uniref:SdpI family protein n=1 Tax=Brevundimonas sp. VNH65 TaxID=3400917 RepID=UPI003C0D33FA